VLESGGEVALEIMFDDEDVEEVGVAVGAEDVPGKGGATERCDRDGMKQADGVAPALGEEPPEKYGAAGKNHGGRAFREDGETEEESGEQQGEPGSAREDGCVLISRETQDDGSTDHRDR